MAEFRVHALHKATVSHMSGSKTNMLSEVPTGSHMSGANTNMLSEVHFWGGLPTSKPNSMNHMPMSIRAVHTMLLHACVCFFSFCSPDVRMRCTLLHICLKKKPVARLAHGDLLSLAKRSVIWPLRPSTPPTSCMRRPT